MKRKKAGDSLKITDTTFRDGHQSTLATRLRTEDMEVLAPEMDKVGFHSMEVWGGATFDVAIRFLNEDPWERIRTLKRLMPRTPLQMLLRGQNLVGYRHYPDDIVEAFVLHAAECGIDIFRIFDALNDERNLEVSLKAVKKAKKHAQLALCYSLTERKLGGPVYNINYYLKKAVFLEKLGADSLCIKDMAGLLAPDDAYKLIKALKKILNIPVQLHTHYTSGMASMTYLKAAEAGVDIIDTALSPFALRSSQPAVEPVVVALEGTKRDTKLDLISLSKLGEKLEKISANYRDFLNTTKMSLVDTDVLAHQIPGGMITNLVAQLKTYGILERLDEVLKEIPRTRKELGYPPLVTPLSQIVGSQATFNVIAGRYRLMSKEAANYICGFYGKPPAPIDPEVKKIALKFSEFKKFITCRPADLLEPGLKIAKKATEGIAQNIDDILIYALFPDVGMNFLKKKYNISR